MPDLEKSQLAPHPRLAPPPGPVVLLVMDGVGEGRHDAYDAVSVARTPALDSLRSDAAYRTILAHGPYVGLPSETDMGNSEVGHNTLGAGRIFDQGAKRIDIAVDSGAIWTGTWQEIIAQVTQRGTALHLIGLLSDGNVHSNMTHLAALIGKARDKGVHRLFVHALHDGRDVPDRTAEKYVAEVEQELGAAAQATGGTYRIASGGGRMVTTMDRYEADWRIVERGWQAHVLGAARPFASATEAIEQLRKETPGISDQLLSPYTIVDEDGRPVGAIQDGDCVVFFNFRGDRAIELSWAFTAGADFAGFDRQRVPDVLFAGMTLYDGDTDMPKLRLVEPEPVPDTISELLARTGVTQWAGAETQKFGHVTYFWNGNRSEKFDPATETYFEIPSDQVPFNERPWMKSAETADAIIEAIHSGRFRFIRANFPGGDMVGHTGVFEAAVVAMESVDLAIDRIDRAVKAARGTLVVTADHGNAEDMIERDKQGEPVFLADGTPRWKTAHSTNPIPLIIADYADRDVTFRDDVPKGGLANVASTLIELLGYEAPVEYEPTLLDS
ncbi:2,3-bisphosphoglycerate-independent phosphoglycerate mutase [Hamadaea flava]|uniref:2,3-bisphosphoglycerate-independent phosphoglycerate mutase n=1 Tax=Hamadaea flava TaxID=1742688 RepID=A0ABV8LGT7_9ACTN|nr:2,3-bisphosphoglycerate-independent phosphoglycerate mutase [Hamadaea flava]MCP2326440.1 2,3-bisphosphoglycerate-independent phosphoglycerate mutase [Hamadaea flava]